MSHAIGSLNNHPASDWIGTRPHGLSFSSFRSAKDRASDESYAAAYAHETLGHTNSRQGNFLSSPTTSTSSAPSDSVPSGSSFPLSSSSTSFTTPTSCSSHSDPLQNARVVMLRGNNGPPTYAPRTPGNSQTVTQPPIPSFSRLNFNTSEPLPAPPRSRLSLQNRLSSTPPTSVTVTAKSGDRKDPPKTRSMLLFSDVLTAATSPSAAEAETTPAPHSSSFTPHETMRNPDLATPANVIVNGNFSTSAPMALSNSDKTIIVREPKPPLKRSGSTLLDEDTQRQQQQRRDIDENGHRSYTPPTYRESPFVPGQYGLDALGVNAAGKRRNANGRSSLLLRSHSDSRSRRPSLGPISDPPKFSSDVETETAKSSKAGANSLHLSERVGAGRPKQHQKPNRYFHPIFPPGTIPEGGGARNASPPSTSGSPASDQSLNPRPRTRSSGTGPGAGGQPLTNPTTNTTCGGQSLASSPHFSPLGRWRQQQTASVNLQASPPGARFDSPVAPHSPAEGGSDEEDGGAARTLPKFQRLRSASSSPSPQAPISPVHTQALSQFPPIPKRSLARGAPPPGSSPVPVPAPVSAVNHAGSARANSGAAGDRTSTTMAPGPRPPPPRPPPPPPKPLTSNQAAPTVSSPLPKSMKGAGPPPDAQASTMTSGPSLDNHLADSSRTTRDSIASLHPFAAASTGRVDKYQNSFASSTSSGRTRKAPPASALVSAPHTGGVRVGVVSSSVSVSSASGGSATITPLKFHSGGSDSKIAGRMQPSKDDEQHVGKKDRRRFASKLKLPKMFGGKSKNSPPSSISTSPTTPYAATFSTLSSSSSSSVALPRTNARATSSASAASTGHPERETNSSAVEFGKSRLVRPSPQFQPSVVRASDPKPDSEIAAGRQRPRRFTGSSCVTDSVEGFITPGASLALSSAGSSMLAVPADEKPPTHSRMTPSSLLFGPKPAHNYVRGADGPATARGLVAPSAIAPLRPHPTHSASYSSTQDAQSPVSVPTLGVSESGSPPVPAGVHRLARRSVRGTAAAY